MEVTTRGLIGALLQWIDALQKIDIIGYPVRFAQALSIKIATPDEG